MKIPLSCIQCSMDKVDRGEKGPFPGGPFFMADITDTGIYIGDCDKAHTMVVVLQHEKYEVLYQSGAVAHLYGFHREAVSSAATALERFFEFCCFVFWEQLGVDAEVARRTWKPMSKSSERQFGAFLTLYPIVLGTEFPAKQLRHQKLTETRNSVVHSGRIPSRDESEAYLRGVYEVIESTMTIIREDCMPAADKVHLRGISASHRAATKEAGQSASGMSLGILVVGRLHDNTTGFENRMALLTQSIGMHVLAPQRPT